MFPNSGKVSGAVPGKGDDWEGSCALRGTARKRTSEQDNIDGRSRAVCSYGFFRRGCMI